MCIETASACKYTLIIQINKRDLHLLRVFFTETGRNGRSVLSEQARGVAGENVLRVETVRAEARFQRFLRTGQCGRCDIRIVGAVQDM